MLISRVVSLWIVFYAGTVIADQFHYHNVISGDRSMGLGGAYAGISTDASGVMYNPAGMGYALTNDVQGSANAMFRKKITYKNAIGKNDFEEKSEGQLAPFLGGLQRLDHISPGLVLAFGIYTNDTDLKDQNDDIQDVDLGIVAFRRTANQRASTTYFGAAIAKRFTPTISVGFGTNYLKVDELTQEYQDVVTVAGASAVDANRSFYQILTQNTRNRLLVDALQPVLGIQIAPIPKLSLGLTLKYAAIVAESYETYNQSTRAIVDQDAQVVTKEEDAEEAAARSGEQTVAPGFLGGGKILGRDLGSSYKHKNPMKSWPLEVRAGMAYYANTRLLLAADIIHHGEAKKGMALFNREAVTNFALGTEYYVTTSIPIRMGLFSNLDARPKPKEGGINQADHIDYYGFSFFAGWVQPNSQIAAGIISQQGKGTAQKRGGVTAIQNVVAQANILAISIASNF